MARIATPASPEGGGGGGGGGGVNTQQLERGGVNALFGRHVENDVVVGAHAEPRVLAHLAFQLLPRPSRHNPA